MSQKSEVAAPPTPEDLWPAYYEELRGVASAVVRGEPRSPSLQPTLVLHEAYLKVFGGGVPKWRGRAYFVASMARAMRQYLVDRARRRRVERRALPKLATHDVAAFSFAEAGRHPEEFEALNAAIDELARRYPRAAAVVELRCAYEFSNAELADLLGIADRTVKADWQFARTWLFDRLSRDGRDERVPSGEVVSVESVPPSDGMDDGGPAPKG
jgi:RNA polymerase sigma factor (TIGR02999 family)